MTFVAALSPLLALVSLCVIGAAFTIAATTVAHRFGRAAVISFWFAASIGLGTFGTLRALAIQRSAGIDPSRVSGIGTFALLSVALMVIFGPPATAVWRRARAGTTATVARQGFLGMAWTLLGLILTIAVALVLDLANVPFIPVR